MTMGSAFFPGLVPYWTGMRWIEPEETCQMYRDNRRKGLIYLPRGPTGAEVFVADGRWHLRLRSTLFEPARKWSRF